MQAIVLDSDRKKHRVSVIDGMAPEIEAMNDDGTVELADKHVCRYCRKV